MTPAETLHAAADLLDEWADRLPRAPWSTTPAEDSEIYWNVLSSGTEIAETFPTLADSHAGEPMARWVAAWSPGFARLLAEYLRDLGADAVEMAADMRAVALAEVILVALKK